MRNACVFGHGEESSRIEAHRVKFRAASFAAMLDGRIIVPSGRFVEFEHAVAFVYELVAGAELVETGFHWLFLRYDLKIR